MKPFRLLLCLAALVLAAVACGPEEPEKQTISVSPSSLTFPAEGGTLTVSVTSNGSWYVSIEGEWAKVNTSAGSGNGSFDVTVSSNSGDARQCALTVSTADNKAAMTVHQEALAITPISSVRALY